MGGAVETGLGVLSRRHFWVAEEDFLVCRIPERILLVFVSSVTYVVAGIPLIHRSQGKQRSHQMAGTVV
jgi:hypothetical protein